MPRPLRLEFENAWYHVMNRGAGKQIIYKTDLQRKKFLEIVAQSVDLFGAEIHAYCLMDNHYHLLVKTPRSNLSRIMRHINGLYTQYFNAQEGTDGSLFRGRYKAIVVDGDSYLLQASRYIHLNPLAAKMVQTADQYLWSSYSAYLDPARRAPWLKVEELSFMSSPTGNPAIYQRFVEAGIDEETRDFYGRAKIPVIFGEREKRNDFLKNLDKSKIKPSLSDYKNTRELPSLRKISQFFSTYFNITEADLFRPMRGKVNEPRKISIYCSRVWASEKLSTIAELYNCLNHSSISNTVREINDRLLRDKGFSVLMASLRDSLMA